MNYNELIEGINKLYNTVEPISVADYPTLNPYSQRIEEQIRRIINAIGDLEEFVDNDSYCSLLKELLETEIDEKGSNLISVIGRIKLKSQFKVHDNTITTLSDLEKNVDNITGEEEKKRAKEILNRKKNIDSIVIKPCQMFNKIWAAIKSIKGIKINETNPTIQKLSILSSLLPSGTHVSQVSSLPSPQWNELRKNIEFCVCNKWRGVRTLIASTVIIVILLIIAVLFIIMPIFLDDRSNWELTIGSLKININAGIEWWHYLYIVVILTTIITAIVLVFYKYMNFQFLQFEREAKLKEKMMDNIVTSFNEDREYNMLETKTEMSLHEKLEKARIEQWERNNEHIRKMNNLAQEQRAKSGETLIELAKIQNTERPNRVKAVKSNQENQEKQEKTETIVIEGTDILIKGTSILSDIFKKGQ